MYVKSTYKIMKTLFKTPDITDLKLRESFRSQREIMDFVFAFDYLVKEQCIAQGSSSDGAIYRLTPKGEGEYLNQRRSNFDFRFTQVIAFIGAATGIAGTILGIIALKTGAAPSP